MTERQRIAYDDPSARAYDTLAPKFFAWMQVGPILYSTILSVNK